MTAEVVFYLRLYLTLIILREQQSSYHCRDVRASLYYIREGLYKALRLREILKVIRPSAEGKLPQLVSLHAEPCFH